MLHRRPSHRVLRPNLLECDPMRKSLTIALVSVVLLSGCTMTALQNSAQRTPPPPWPLTPAQTAGHGAAAVAFGHRELNLQIADTEPERNQGLSNLDAVPGDGMLFVFDGAGDYAIWMKDTRIPLDILWLRDGRVVHIEADVQPEPGVADSSLTIYQSPESSDAIIELAAGQAGELGLKPGSELELISLE